MEIYRVNGASVFSKGVIHFVWTVHDWVAVSRLDCWVMDFGYM